MTATVDGAGARDLGGHPVEAGDGVGPRLVDPLVGGVVVDRVGHQQQGAVGVVEHRDVGGDRHHQRRHAELVGGVLGQALPVPHGVVPDHPDHPAGQRRQPLEPRRVQRVEGAGQRLESRSAGGHAHRRLAQPVRLPVDLGEGRARRGAHDRVPRPDPAVLGRLQQERARPVVGELAVQPDRRLGVGEQPADDRDHPAVAGQLAEGVERGPDLAELASRTGGGGGHRPSPSAPAAPWHDRRRPGRARRSTTGCRCGRRGRPGRPGPAARRRRSPAPPTARAARGRWCRPCASTPGGCGSRTSPGRWSGCGAAPRRPSSRPSAPGRRRAAARRRRPARRRRA